MTLIEILVVVGVIAILASIAVFGFRALARNANRNKTKVVLKNAASMLAEYDAATGLKQQPPYMYDTAGTKVTTNFDVWHDANPATPVIDALPVPPGSVDADDYQQGAAGKNSRLESPGVMNAAVVLREIGRVPNVKKILTQVPQDSLLETWTNPKSGGIKDPVKSEPSATVLIDAWGNPIIYVPASGLADVKLGDAGVKYVIRSDKVYTRGDFDAAVNATPPRLPTGRPFFASAGPDGSFENGDDNVYSFEN
jgi:type II secretory pathway pseudopilin PulG